MREKGRREEKEGRGRKRREEGGEGGKREERREEGEVRRKYQIQEGQKERGRTCSFENYILKYSFFCNSLLAALLIVNLFFQLF